MTLSPLPSSPALTFAGFTQNGETSGGVLASFDLLNLFGTVVLVLDADTLTTSTGAGQSATRICFDDATGMTAHRHLSVRTTDSSTLMAKYLHATHSDMSGTTHLFSGENTGGVSPASLLVALGGFVALLMKSALQCTPQDQS